MGASWAPPPVDRRPCCGDVPVIRCWRLGAPSKKSSTRAAWEGRIMVRIFARSWTLIAEPGTLTPPTT